MRTKGLMKVFSDGFEWRMTGLLRGSVEECVGSRTVGRPLKRWIENVKDCMIGVYGGGL